MTLQPHAEGWSFVEGSWQVDDQGVIVPPHNLGDENLAIYNEHAFGDFEAEYEFRWDSVWTDAGWANGAMFEIEPDVVLFAYGSKETPKTLRGQIMRITEDTLEPLVVN